jgi:hypothetical protein
MEELRSTEVLEQEILEDAKKKAARLLKTAEDSIASQAKQWEKKTKDSIQEIHKVYEKRALKLREEIHSRNILDKRRLRSETTDFLLREAMDTFLHGLERGEILLILEKELERDLEECRDELGQGEVRVLFSSMNGNEAKEALQKAANKSKVSKDLPISEWSINEDKKASTSFPVIILNTPMVKITASVENVAIEFLKEKRAELTSALLGEEALDG